MSPVKRMGRSFRSASAPVQGAVWMVLACTFLGTMNTMVPFLAERLHPFEIAFFRNLGQIVFMLPWLMMSGLAVLKTNRIGTHLLRSVTGIIAMLCWFSALAMVPVAHATALSFTAPLFTTLGAALILGEVVRMRRWSATLMGFVGALVILRPGVETLDLGSILALAGSAAMAASALVIKSLSRTDSPSVMVLYMGVFMTLFSLPPALFVWVTPDGETLLWLAAMGGLATLAHICINRSFQVADASAVVPFDFVRLLVAAVLGYWFLGQAVDVWTWIGGGIIFVATAYITRREAQLAKQTVLAVGPGLTMVGGFSDQDSDHDSGPDSDLDSDLDSGSRPARTP